MKSKPNQVSWEERFDKKFVFTLQVKNQPETLQTGWNGDVANPESVKDFIRQEIDRVKMDIWEKDNFNTSLFRFQLHNLIWAIENKDKIDIIYYIKKAKKALKI